ncbi:MAG TPA: SulP family inorganic anion transporter, partial [Deltaproteobacteria bacterium]|nr:SulP family inorganic anion transporter [Deltaproteobacteria bacterium]
LPLCLGIALASEAPLMSGIVAGGIGGLVVGSLSGSRLSVSGPAAGLAVIVAEGIHALGSFETFLCAVILAGGLQLLLGVARLGLLASLFPHSVIRGMLAAIGIILILKQIPHALGRDEDYEGDLGFWVPGTEETTFSEIALALASFSPGVVLVTSVSLAVLLAWEHPMIAKRSWSRIVPGPLVAVVLAVVVNALLGTIAPSWSILASEGHLVRLPADGSVGARLLALPHPEWSQMGNPAVWKVAGVIAAIASIESLLSVEAIDKLDPLRRTTPTNRELFAQGAGNIVSGVCGGLPVTSVIVRSSANLYSGARSRASTITHGVLLAMLVALVPALLNRIPLAALAAVLLVVGYKLARIELFKQMWRDGIDQFLPFVTTIVVTVLSDLLAGVLIGVAVAAVMVLITNRANAIRVANEGPYWLLQLTKDVSFLNKPRLRTVLQQIPPGSQVEIDAGRAQFIDHDIREVIEDFAASAPHRDLTVTIRGMKSRPFPLQLPKTWRT